MGTNWDQDSIILVYYMYHIDAKDARSGPEADFGTLRRKPLYKSWIGGGNIGVARHMQFHDFTLFVILSLGWFPQCRQNTFFLPELGKPTVKRERTKNNVKLWNCISLGMAPWKWMYFYCRLLSYYLDQLHFLFYLVASV